MPYWKVTAIGSFHCEAPSEQDAIDLADTEIRVEDMGLEAVEVTREEACEWLDCEED